MKQRDVPAKGLELSISQHDLTSIIKLLGKQSRSSDLLVSTCAQAPNLPRYIQLYQGL